MNQKFLIKIATLFIAFSAFSCFEEDDKYSDDSVSAAAGDITFSVPTGALAPPPTGQSQLTQPSLDLVAGRFAITDDLKMTIGLSSEFTSLSVKAVNTTTGVSVDKGPLTVANNAVDWTYPMNTIGLDGKAPATFPTTTVLIFTAANADNSKTASRAFSVTVTDPFTLPSTNPTTSYPDSLSVLTYTVPALTTVANLTKVEIFTKIGKNSAETLYRTKNYADVSKTDTVKYRMRSVIPGQDLTKPDTAYFRFVATFATGRTVTKSSIIRAINVPLATRASTLPPKKTEGTTALSLYNSASVSNVGKTAFDFGTINYDLSTASEVGKDLILVVNGADIGFRAGTGNGTRFVKTTSAAYTSASFQSARNIFLAGTPLTSVSNVYVNDVYIAEIDGGKGSSQYIAFRVSAVTLTAADNNDFIVFDYKLK